MNEKISIIVPVYMGEAFVDDLYRRVKTAVLSVSKNWELILVNDASPDHSWDKITQICQNDPAVRGVNLSRNFGQHAAITAGLTVASGDRMIVMDCDLQDVPEDIPNLLHAAYEQNADVVQGQRLVRKDTFLKRLSSKLFGAAYGYLADTKIDSSVANFGVYSRKVVDAVLSMHDAHKNFPLFVRWVGFKTTAVPVTHAARPSGKSSYTLRKLIRFAFDSILSFSDKPLRLMVIGGFLTALISFLIGLYFLIFSLLGQIHVHGFASLIVSIWFLAGVQIFFLGVVGIYISKTYTQTKGRPVFIIDKILNGTLPKNKDGQQDDNSKNA